MPVRGWLTAPIKFITGVGTRAQPSITNVLYSLKSLFNIFLNVDQFRCLRMSSFGYRRHCKFFSMHAVPLFSWSLVHGPDTIVNRILLALMTQRTADPHYVSSHGHISSVERCPASDINIHRRSTVGWSIVRRLGLMIFS